jgi:hypothetical protein
MVVWDEKSPGLELLEHGNPSIQFPSLRRSRSQCVRAYVRALQAKHICASAIRTH